MKRRKREKKRGLNTPLMPEAFVRQESACVARGTVSEGGVPLLTYKMTLPAFASEAAKDRAASRMNAFYARVASELLRGCERTLFPFVRRQYVENDDPHKRFRFARYALTVDFTVTAQGGVLCVERRAVLSRRGRVLCERTWCECFEEKDGRVLTPRFSHLIARVKPKKGLRDTLKGVISKHTGERGKRIDNPFSEASNAARKRALPSASRQRR